MTIATLRIPRSAFALICQKSEAEAFADMVENFGLPFMEALTFAAVNTPITSIATGEIKGYVLWWITGQCSVHVVDGEWLKTIGLEQHTLPTPAEAVELFDKYYVATDAMPD